MGRPKGGTNKTYSKEEKLEIVLKVLEGKTLRALEAEYGVNNSLIHKWMKQYLAGGEEALINKRKTGNPLSKYTRKKVLTYTEQLEYENALLKRELLKKDAEVVRLKKSIELERGDVKRR